MPSTLPNVNNRDLYLLRVCYFCQGVDMLFSVPAVASLTNLKNQGWKLNNLTSVIHYSYGVSFNYSLVFLSSCWLFIIHNHLFIIPVTWL